jgi:hypothetical protein
LSGHVIQAAFTFEIIFTSKNKIITMQSLSFDFMFTKAYLCLIYNLRIVIINTIY